MPRHSPPPVPSRYNVVGDHPDASAARLRRGDVLQDAGDEGGSTRGYSPRRLRGHRKARRLFRPFRALIARRSRSPGRCPGLICFALSGQESRPFGSGILILPRPGSGALRGRSHPAQRSIEPDRHLCIRTRAMPWADLFSPFRARIATLRVWNLVPRQDLIASLARRPCSIALSCGPREHEKSCENT